MSAVDVLQRNPPVACVSALRGRPDPTQIGLERRDRPKGDLQLCSYKVLHSRIILAHGGAVCIPSRVSRFVVVSQPGSGADQIIAEDQS
jgi:hypothetical protein